jgi:hypothetical protein
MADKQTNIVANPERHMVFFEGENLAYNYATDQWSRVPAYAGLGYFGVQSKSQDIGLVIYSAGSVDLQEQLESYDVQDTTIATGAVDLNQYGRSVITGVRPINNGGTMSVQVGSQDAVTDSADWTSATSVNSRTGLAPFRKEGRYHRLRISSTGQFNQIVGADIELAGRGKV